ncbi:unnamed protein product [Toxocara canis]|uniref:Uncharacterized protein n=1 Tax=Toxocara canis TaxID=6265 RepID=A0A183VDG2_TOXCA|nr:unnamed protein product [Toxocara canis]
MFHLEQPPSQQTVTPLDREHRGLVEPNQRYNQTRFQLEFTDGRDAPASKRNNSFSRPFCFYKWHLSSDEMSEMIRDRTEIGQENICGVSSLNAERPD